MTDPITIGSLTVSALATGTKAIIDGVASETAKDAYKAIKQIIRRLIGANIDSIDDDDLAKAIDQRPEHDREVLRKLVETLIARLPAEPNLELNLLEPKDASCVLPKKVKANFREWIDRESLRMGLQSIDWTANALRRHRPETAEADGHQMVKGYARVLREWYEGVAADVSSRYAEETDRVRSVTVALQLKNSGTLPAKKIQIELRAEPSTLVSVSRSRPYGLRPSGSAPVPPPSLGLPVPKDTERPYISWYDLPREIDRSTYDPHEVRLSDDDPMNKRTPPKLLTAELSELQHGKEKLLRPFYIIFGEHPVQDIKISHKIFAANQRKVSSGDLRISVLEQQND